ncbi:hypothetical protein IRZ71_10715 [Flavobacterium sp. ANB]|uniref:hypothetical protein n=1 Tax=unclassified Flavobacterium TaxID=196869 RepID=UPI0012BA2F35|nr:MULTISPECIES: hypothetical protein [unclassified Flavobacterium]MBF4516821.1 hypothetical protein [Flavobacterium sp. ANB]MTD69283.1 hypothetical protein [Flavobacterium sp. LC2016-13]
MRLLIVLFFATLISCVDKKTEKQNLTKNETEITNSIQTVIDCGDFTLKIDIDKEDFNVINKGDSIFIYKILPGSIESRKINIVEKDIQLNNIRIDENLEFKFYQRMTDDNQSSPLNISFNRSNKPKLLSNTFLSSSSESFNTSLFDQHFSEVKNESLEKQNLFYKNLLNNKKKYENCCPEYIVQAKNFLKKDDKSFTNFESLNITSFINKNIIIIRYEVNKRSKSKVIILNEDSKKDTDSNLVSSDSTKTSEQAKEINSWEFSPNAAEKLKLILYAPTISSKNEDEYFNYGFLVIDGGKKRFQTQNIIRLANKNSPYSAFEKIVFKNNFFTIEQHGNSSDYSTYEYITFKYENGAFYLHKYSIEYTSKNNPDENTPSKNWLKKDFGLVKLEDVTPAFLDDLKNK